MAKSAGHTGESIRTPAAYPDRGEVWEAEHYRRRCASVRHLMTEELLEEHRRNPFGYRDHHSLGLQRLQRMLKTYPANGVRYAPCLADGVHWRLMAFRRGRDPVLLDEPVLDTLEEAAHEMLLLRIGATRQVLGEE
jgi:hypothetical protein